MPAPSRCLRTGACRWAHQCAQARADGQAHQRYRWYTPAVSRRCMGTPAVSRRRHARPTHPIHHTDSQPHARSRAHMAAERTHPGARTHERAHTPERAHTSARTHQSTHTRARAHTRARTHERAHTPERAHTSARTHQSAHTHLRRGADDDIGEIAQRRAASHSTETHLDHALRIYSPAAAIEMRALHPPLVLVELFVGRSRRAL